MVYYVEDDQNIRDLAIYALKAAGVEACGFPNGDRFFEACRRRTPEAVLLDIMLPGKDGLTLLAEIRAHPGLAHIPVMMLSAKGSEIDKVTGLDAGADDYLAKPFGMMELASRTKALLRRAHGTTASQDADLLACGPLTLDAASHKAFAQGAEVALTLKEFSLLQELMEHPGRVLSRSQLLEHVWGWAYTENTRTVDVHIQTLRQKLAQVAPGCDSLIKTVRGIGYVLEA